MSQHGSTLTCKNLADMAAFTGTLLSLEADAGKRPRQVTVDGFSGVLNRMEADPPCWYTFTHFLRLMYGKRLHRKSGDFSDGTLTNITNKYLREAEHTKDPCRIACCKLYLAERLFMKETWNYDKLEEVVAKIKEQEKKCQPWFPRVFRTGTFPKVPKFEWLLETARKSHPDDYRELSFPPDGELVRQAFATFQSKPSAGLRENAKCAKCGSGRLDLSCCSAVSYT